MSSAPFLVGDRVTLHPVDEDDYAFLGRHWNDPAVRPGFGAVTPRTADDVAEYVATFSGDDDKEIFLVRADGDRVGEAFLFELRPTWGNVEVGYWVAPPHRGNGYATGALELLVDYCFTERRLHKVDARVLAFNEASRRVLERVGFEREGCRREECYVDGEYVDAHLYGLLAAEWDGPRRDGGDGGEH